MNYDLKQIRKVVDSNEIFAASHGEEAPRRAHGLRKVPAWTKSDTEIRKILCRVFPKLAHNAQQRKSAARWLRVIYLCFRIGMTRGQIAEELHVNNNTIRELMKHIRRAAAGRTGNNRNQRGLRSRGRPAKIVTPIVSSLR